LSPRCLAPRIPVLPHSVLYGACYLASGRRARSRRASCSSFVAVARCPDAARRMRRSLRSNSNASAPRNSILLQLPADSPAPEVTVYNIRKCSERILHNIGVRSKRDLLGSEVRGNSFDDVVNLEPSTINQERSDFTVDVGKARPVASVRCAEEHVTDNVA